MRATVLHEDKILCQNYDTLMVIYWRNILYFLFALLIDLRVNFPSALLFKRFSLYRDQLWDGIDNVFILSW